MSAIENSLVAQFMYLVNKVNAQLGEQLSPYSLTIPTSVVLVILLDHQGITQIELANIKHMDRTTCSKIVDNLEQLGYLTRERSTTDRRAFNLFLTKEGTKVANEVLQLRIAQEQALFHAIQPEYKEQFLQILRQMIQTN